MATPNFSKPDFSKRRSVNQDGCPRVIFPSTELGTSLGTIRGFKPIYYASLLNQYISQLSHFFKFWRQIISFSISFMLYFILCMVNIVYPFLPFENKEKVFLKSLPCID